MELVASSVVRAARERAGLSQAELGARAGVPQSVVSAYERGRRDPSLGSLRRLVRAAGVDLEIDLGPVAVQQVPFRGPIGQRLQRRRSAARELLLERGCCNPAVFGSVARGEDTVGSDIDLLVDVPPGVGLTQLVRASIDLGDLVGARVDLVPREGLRERVAREIEHDLVPL